MSIFTSWLPRIAFLGALLVSVSFAQAPPETVTPAPAAGATTTPAPAPPQKAPAASPAPKDAAPMPDAAPTATPVAPAPVATTPSAANGASDADANANANADADANSNDAKPETVVNPASLLPAVPALPAQKASLIGGTVDKMDRVKDELTIRVFGGGKMKVAFDARTKILKNGDPALPSDLRRGDHVSIDTILNSSAVFARTIRLTTSIPGESQGTVTAYHDANHELEVRDRLSPRILKLRLTPQTRISDQGKNASPTELANGTLVSIRFGPQREGRNTVEEITVLAVPGRNFTFVGHVTNVDFRTGLIVLTSSTDGKTYEISYDPADTKIGDTMGQAADVTVIARFEGNRYVAQSVKSN